ncbi:PWWP domain-containing protein MUM1L1-like [Sinocyclocheilus rhinocerous]|uniref:PWWP domain-containing protein MUM1L1-like n=1 Tax=Sinocyclocheilus rhinocerous TaxID=307959 RepID=UPI0007B90863|nr:PREDICTED: PWWP domain-containing protein MUM1L1-like [Sinocyclocheilus rhinocerous]
MSSHRRRNPHRTCRPISQVLLELNKPVSESRGQRTTKKEKPQAANQNALPDLSACLQKSTHQLTDRTPSRRVRHQKPVAAGRPRDRKKKNVEEQPIASPPVKRGRKSAASRLESPQEEPSIETPPPNKAHFETQVSEPQESGRGDRSKAARNRANKQLVDFIIRRKVESRLLAVISGRESSKWMQALQKPSRPVVDVYLEDEEQVDKVYRYLNKVCDSAPQINTCLENIQADRIRLILDVLLPEAIIYAIAGVHKLSLEKAEEQYRRGPCFSNRERQEFDMMIEQQMKLKEITRHHRQ